MSVESYQMFSIHQLQEPCLLPNCGRELAEWWVELEGQGKMVLSEITGYIMALKKVKQRPPAVPTASDSKAIVYIAHPETPDSVSVCGLQLGPIPQLPEHLLLRCPWKASVGIHSLSSDKQQSWHLQHESGGADYLLFTDRPCNQLFNFQVPNPIQIYLTEDN